MLTSLRSRLWFTYALVIGVVLLIIGVGLLIFLVRNPISLKLSYARLQTVTLLVENRSGLLGQASREQIQSALQNAENSLGVRVLILSSDGNLLVDSRPGAAPPPTSLTLPAVKAGSSVNNQFRDDRGRIWVYSALRMNNGYIAVAALPRLQARFPQVIRDAVQGELFGPFLQAGLIALLVSLVIVVWVSRWISAPLQRMAAAAREVASGQYHPIPLEGPREVQDLAQAFNEMTGRVVTTQKSQRDFIANVSHELKTPLTSIRGFAQAMLDGVTTSPEEVKQAAGVIYSEADRMNRLVLELLDLARLDAGIAPMELRPLDLEILLGSVVEKLEPQARQAQVEIQVQIAPLPRVLGDADRLDQVFTNLVENALKYTPAGGQVSLQAALNNGMAEVSVADTGQGIPPEDLEHIFDRFYQVDKSRKGGVDHGAGLGLAIAREIVLAHHGLISANSSPGKGSVFMVKLPVSNPGEPGPAKRAA